MRKFLSVLLCLAMVAGFALPVAAEQVQADVYIRSLEEFLTFAENCRLDSYSMDLTVSLEADIDLKDAEFEGVPIFCGTFLGNGHRISGVNITVKGSQRGLFRYLTQSALVQDLKVAGKVAPQGSRMEVGGIVGNLQGCVRNCVFEGTVSGGDLAGGIAGVSAVGALIEDCSVVGSVQGKHFVGGIVGQNMGTVRGCENRATVNTTAQQNTIDLSDITIGTITGTESASTVTDIGGIAGTSSGTVRGCVNRGNVGYKHMGYNVGGIVGTHSGYLVDCKNFGAIAGRKEIGGIVGQMEPSVLLAYETDTLQMLKVQLAVLSDLTDRAALNAQNNTAQIQALMAQMENHVANAEEALDVLTIDPEDPQIHDPDTYLAAIQTLGASITGIDSTMRKLYAAIKETGDDLSQDLQAIADQVEVIDGLLNNAEENLGGTVSDVSDLDTPEDLTGKVENVINHGSILGDLNVGGIVGAMGLENDLDPEQDVTISGEITLNAAGQLRSVVLQAVNRGSVNARRRNSGGIVGWQSLGLVKNSDNLAAVTGSDHVGGIAGQSLGYIRNCSVKAVITGDNNVGGIAGTGTVVSECRSMIKLSGQEFVGAILGNVVKGYNQTEDPIRNNVYTCVEADLGAIDGISYDTMAQSVTLEAFLAQPELQEMFKTVNVVFRFEDSTETVIPVTPGEGLDMSLVPAVPEKPGYEGHWEGLEEAQLDHILFDLTFEVYYVSHGTAIQSAENRNGRPLLLVQGDFLPNATVTLSNVEVLPTLTEGQTHLESWQITTEGCEHTSGLRYLIPKGADTDRLIAYIRGADGAWSQAEYRVEGSYLVVAVECGTDGIALVQDAPVEIPWMFIAIAGGVFVVLVLVISLVAARRKKIKKLEKSLEVAIGEL